MKDTITAMFCFCDDFLKANNYFDDYQCRVYTTQGITTSLVAVAFVFYQGMGRYWAGSLVNLPNTE